MSFLTALLGAAGGYGAGKQQRFQDTQEQQRTANEGAYLDLDKQKQQLAVDAYTRNRGIDPATGKPFLLPPNLSQVAPNNKGKAATDAQTLQHLYLLAQQYTQNGQTDLAAATLDRAKAMESDIRQTNALTMRQLLDLYNQGQQDQRMAAIIGGANARNQNTTDAALQRTLDIIAGANERNIRTTDTSLENQSSRNAVSLAETQMRIGQQGQAQLSQDRRGYERENAIATREGKPLPYPNLDPYNKNMGAAIAAVAKDPKSLARYVSALQSHAGDYGPSLTAQGVQMLKDAAAQAMAASATTKTGGSQAIGNPPPSPWP